MLDKNLKSKHEYIARINRVQDFVKSNLDGDLSLDRLSAIACFSKFYFNRIFKAVAGESLNDYVNRARVEASAFTLMRRAHKPITTTIKVFQVLPFFRGLLKRIMGYHLVNGAQLKFKKAIFAKWTAILAKTSVNPSCILILSPNNPRGELI
jgi:AraC-like DNA-binding protein